MLDRQPVQRAGDRAEVLPATMQIDHRRGEAGVTEKSADRQQVHPRFQKSGRVTVSQYMGVNTFFDPGPLGGVFDRFLDRRVRVRLVRSFAGKQKLAGTVLLPVRPQFLQQSRRQRHESLLGPLAVGDPDLHPRRVDIGDLQVGCFGKPHPAGVEGREERFVLEVRSTSQQLVDFLSAEHRGQMFRPFAEGDHGDRPRDADRVGVQKP